MNINEAGNANIDYDERFNEINEKIETIQIGKTNLLSGTYDGTGWQNAGLDEKTHFSVEKGVFTYSNDSTNPYYFYTETVSLQQGEQYTLSFWYKTEGEAEDNFGFLDILDRADPDRIIRTIYENQEEWSFYKFTFIPLTGWQEKELSLRFYNPGRSAEDNRYILSLKGIKLERGNVASDWDFSPEDMVRFYQTNAGRLDIMDRTLYPNKNWLAGTGRRTTFKSNGLHNQLFPLYKVEKEYTLAEVMATGRPVILSFDIEVEGGINENSGIEIVTTHTGSVLVEGFKPISGKEHKTITIIPAGITGDDSLSVRLNYIPENSVVVISNMKLEKSDYETIYISNDTDFDNLLENYRGSVNLFTNPGFSEGLSGWTVSPGVEAKVTAAPAAPSGKAIHIISATDNQSGITQVYPYEVGKTYSITVYAKAETEGQRLRIVGANCKSVVVTLSTAYRPYTFTFIKEDESGDNIHFQKYGAQDPAVWISSPVLIEGGIPIPWHVADIYNKMDEIKLGSYVVQDTEPDDKTAMWVDSSEPNIPDYRNEDLLGLYEAVHELAAYCNDVVKYAFTRVMSPGDFRNNAVNDMKEGIEAEPPGGMPAFMNVIKKLTTGEAAAGENADEYNEWDPEYPGWADDFSPNLKHITIKSGSKADLEGNFSDFIDNELLWAKDTRQLYIKSNGQPVLLNSGGGTGGGSSIDYDALDKLDTIGFIAGSGSTFRVKVNNNGELVVYRKELDTGQPAPTGSQTDPATGWEYMTTLYLPKLYINSLYCGGIDQDEYSYNPCSHNFVELSNLTGNNIPLKGLSLQYASEGGQWQVLPLEGEIKAGSTFLVRGAQCSVMNINTTRIQVDTYDMEWYASDGKLIRFDNTKGKFLLTWGTTACSVSNPFNTTLDTTRVSKGYIDMVGLQIENAGDADKIDAAEVSPYSYMSPRRLFTKYYTMDPVSQATKAINARNNANDWYFVNLEADIIPNVDDYVPKASFQNKNLFYNKSKLTENKPNLITVSFGIQATAPNATRCFNWVSRGYYDEYVFWREKDGSSWNKMESFKNQTGVRRYYNRIRMVATDGTPFTTHKAIVRNLAAGQYQYYIGRDDSYKSDIYEFEVKDSSEVTASGFRFLQVSDQQGFNRDEYEVWRITAGYIRDNEGELDFMINTGDMTQNGNRINEWIDYDNARMPVANLCQMITVGNNDLTPANVYILGDGGDNSKINATNVQFFYTYEIDEENPPVFMIDGKEVFVESLYSFNYGNAHYLCVNSEISSQTEIQVYGAPYAGALYDYIREWCVRDVEKTDDSIKWKIAYCHEMPFTIITHDLINSFYWNGTEYPSVERSGSRLNFNTSNHNKYWFSRFLQDYGFRLVLGGHKHTYTCSYPLKENVSANGEIKSMKPVIQVTPEILQKDFNCTSLYSETTGSLAGQSFPTSWQNNANYDIQRHLCTFELQDKISAPVYVMSQATGYKHTSNKELPSPFTPWLRYFFPARVDVVNQTTVTSTVNEKQRYPFYIIFSVSEDRIVGEVKKLGNVFNTAGKYNVNISSSANPPVAMGGNGETNNGNDLIIIE